MSTINIRESLRQLDDDSFCKYDLLTMYDSCPLLDEDKQEIAKLLYNKEDPEVIYQKLCTYFCDDDTSEIDAFNDFVQPGTFEIIVNECVNKLKESCSDAQYNDVANQLEVIKDGELYTTGLAPIEIETGDIEIFVDGNYDSPLAFDSTEDAVNYITDVVLNKLTSTSVDSGDDDVMVYTVYDIVEDDDNRLTAKCMNESTNDFQDIKLGKVNSQKVNELLNNMLNNPNYKITKETKDKIYKNSAPWGLAVQMIPAVDIDGTNGLLSTGDFGGEASFGESIETNFEKDDRVTDGSREGTVLDSDSQKVLVEWDYSETDDIEWVDKSELSFVECLKESRIPMDTVKKDIESYLNYHLGSNEDYIKVNDIQNIDKDTVAVEYEVHLSIPTGNDEYESDTEYRSLAFRYRNGKWEPKLEESLQNNDEDGWGDRVEQILEPTIEKVEDLAYEVRNTVRGANTNCDTTDELADYVDEVIEDFEDANSSLRHEAQEIDESKSINEDLIELNFPSFNELRKQYKNYTTFKDKEKNSGLIRDLCDQLENKEVSYDIYNHKKDNGMTIFYDDCDLVESLAPYKKEEFKKQLQDELYDKFIDLARTPEWGFENLAEIDDYLMPTIEVNDYEGEYDNDIEVEFRAEVNYRELEDVCDTLDKVVKKYDKNAYFEPVQPGIAVAYLKLKESIKESKGPKACKLRELIDEGVVSKDLVVDEFLNYLSEDDIADFLNQYDLEESRITDLDTRRFSMKDVQALIDDYGTKYFEAIPTSGGRELWFSVFDVGSYHISIVDGRIMMISLDDPNEEVRSFRTLKQFGDYLERQIAICSREAELKESSKNELTEASYGGAFDIEDDQYFTKEEIVEVAEKVCENLDETYPDKFDVSDVYMETPKTIHVEVISKEGNWASANAKIDMRKIRKPSDIMKYDVVIGDLVYNLRQELEDLYKA